MQNVDISPKQRFLTTLQTLRLQEEIVIYTDKPEIEDRDTIQILDFSRNEYRKEALNYPHNPPIFDENAALWAAKIVYNTAQLMLYRADKAVELPKLLSDFTGEITPSSALSADLYLRFLPHLITQLHLFDTEDPLIYILENILEKWHYSCINHAFNKESFDIEKLDFQWIINDKCLHQLYVNRILAYKNRKLAEQPVFAPLIAANLGIYGDILATDV